MVWRHPTKEGWPYLTDVIDLDIRRLVGYSVGSRMTQALVVEALQKAITMKCLSKVVFSLVIEALNITVKRFKRMAFTAR